MAVPATLRRKRRDRFVLGVDGCRAGWLVARLNLDDETLTASVAERFSEILKVDALMTLVDMPIGLADDGPRRCEAMARTVLKPLRHASVFSSPLRAMLAFDDYAAANAWGKARGRGLSKQAWMITPKIREIDAVITPHDQARLGEGHPEVAFARLNGGKPCAHPKRKADGAAERRRLLTGAGLADPEALFARVRKEHGAGVARDDVFDACALALSANARLDGCAVRLSDDARDARGLVMEIWG